MILGYLKNQKLILIPRLELLMMVDIRAERKFTLIAAKKENQESPSHSRG